MIERNREQTPADQQHRMAHFRGATGDNQVNEKHKAENSGDDQRSGNGLGSLLGLVRLEVSARVRLAKPFVILYR